MSVFLFCFVYRNRVVRPHVRTSSTGHTMNEDDGRDDDDTNYVHSMRHSFVSTSHSLFLLFLFLFAFQSVNQMRERKIGTNTHTF